jgi:hypothetical protein
MRFETADFLYFQITIFKNTIPNDLRFMIWFKITLIIYKIATLNALLSTSTFLIRDGGLNVLTFIGLRVFCHH